jgi:hypothetical protein
VSHCENAGPHTYANFTKDVLKYGESDGIVGLVSVMVDYAYSTKLCSVLKSDHCTHLSTAGR